MKEKALQVLLVEDNAGDARLLREMFSKERPDSFELTHLLRMSEAVNHLAKGGVDIALLDLGLPDAHGLETVRRAHAVAPDVPVIVLTGLDDEALAAEAMKEGAQDYLIKGQIENRALPRALRHAIERQRMQGETDQIRKQQLQLKDDFLSHVSHELRSPLTAIYQFVTILLDKLAGELNPEQREHLEIVLRNVKQLQSMISDLLEVTRAQSGKLSVQVCRISLTDAITDTMNTFREPAATKSIHLLQEVPHGFPPVLADPARLRQVLNNLVDNALKFTPPGGTITVEAKILDETGRSACISVTDTGCGILVSDQPQIFERLYQAPKKTSEARSGLGLGLHICKELVTRQDGEIWLDSSLNSGTRFCFTLRVFSVARIVEKLFTTRARAVDSVSFLAIEIFPEPGGSCARVSENSLEEARIVVERCLLPDLDVLVPTVHYTASGGLFFVLGFADQNGAEVLLLRLRKQLTGADGLKKAGVNHRIYSKTLNLEREAISGMDHIDLVSTWLALQMDSSTTERSN
jgi:signal transduction histidine kinase